MNWLARLKKIDTAPEPEPTKPTEPGFVGSVGSNIEPVPKTRAGSLAANDAIQDTDPDRWCWPHTVAWNSGDIDTFMARVSGFTDKGLGLDDAENVADTLVIRDRELDDRRMCLECVHLSGVQSQWRCKNYKQALGCNKAADAQLGKSWVLLLQRCNGFAPIAVL